MAQIAKSPKHIFCHMGEKQKSISFTCKGKTGCGFICKKHEGGSDKSEMLCVGQLAPAEKKGKKQNFCQRPCSWGKYGLNISTLSANICSQFYELHSTGPLHFIHILATVCMNCNWFFGNFTAAAGCFQLIPKYKLKVKLIKSKHPIFLSEIIPFRENGS